MRTDEEEPRAGLRNSEVVSYQDVRGDVELARQGLFESDCEILDRAVRVGVETRPYAHHILNEHEARLEEVDEFQIGGEQEVAGVIGPPATCIRETLARRTASDQVNLSS